MIMDYCIVSAGIGSRFLPFSNYANKALAPLPSKPIVSLLIDSIPRESRIHIVTGYLGKDLEYIIASMHEDRNLIFYENKDFLSTGNYNDLIVYKDRYHGIGFSYISQPIQYIFSDFWVEI